MIYYLLGCWRRASHSRLGVPIYTFENLTGCTVCKVLTSFAFSGILLESFNCYQAWCLSYFRDFTPSQAVKSGKGNPNLPSEALSNHPSLQTVSNIHFLSGKSSEGTTPLFDTPTTPHPSREAAEKAKQEAEAEERERMQLLVSSFTEDQLDRCLSLF